jgi:hypothetical protein
MIEERAMQEIHEIRRAIALERQGMSSAEYNALVRKNSEEAARKSGYRYVPVEGKPGYLRLVRI